mgnify:FL=1
MFKNKDGGKMKKKSKIMIILIIAILTIILFINQVNATQVINPDSYKPDSQSDVTGATSFLNMANKLIGIVQIVGSIISVIALILIGIKYLVGSVEERAEYKKTLKPYLIGAIMVFAITNLLAIIQNVVTSF